VAGKSGSFVDEYRIKAGRVEVRALDVNGEPYPGYSEWIMLTPEEIRIHFVKQTPVATWLKKALARSAEQQVEKEASGLRKTTRNELDPAHHS
jgi:hypothetical protein